MEEQWKSKTFEYFWQVCGESLSNTDKYRSRGENTGREEREEICWLGGLFVCLFVFVFLTIKRSSRSKSISHVKKGEERMLKWFALSPTPVLAMW